MGKYIQASPNEIATRSFLLSLILFVIYLPLFCRILWWYFNNCMIASINADEIAIMGMGYNRSAPNETKTEHEKPGSRHNSLRPSDAYNLTIIGWNHGLSPVWHQAIIWINAGLLLIWPLWPNFGEIFIEIHTFLFKKMPSIKWCPFCHGLNVLI